jgi:hypothetical protein
MSRDKSSARSVVAVLLVLAMSLLCAASTRAQSPTANAQVIEIKLADLNDDNPLINYRKAVLELAMRASGRPFSIKGCQVANVATSDQRYVQLVQAGQYCNLIATSAGSGMTRTLEAIPFPIYLGGGATACCWPTARAWNAPAPSAPWMTCAPSPSAPASAGSIPASCRPTSSRWRKATT